MAQIEYDTIIIGSGFGGSMIANVLVNAGERVLMLERGDWVKRGLHNWAPDGSLELTEHYSKETPYRVLEGGNSPIMGAYTCVGGPSVFYGAVSMRLRKEDFEVESHIVGDSGAKWPYKYADLEPYYSQAEKILNIAGEAGYDPSEPFRSRDYPQPLNGLSPTSSLIKDAAKELGLNPFRLPLAINYAANNGKERCAECTTCDTYACALEAKNDLATQLIPKLIKKGLELKTNHVAVRLNHSGKQISGVVCFDKTKNEKVQFRANKYILSAGALASPHLILASGLNELNPGGRVIGRYLTRHCNAIVFGYFPWGKHNSNQFHKQIGINDYYMGHPSIKYPQGKLGNMQQMQTPPFGLIEAMVPKLLSKFLKRIVPRLTGIVVIAEDQPRFSNGVTIDRSQTDKFGLPQLLVTHQYSKRDYAARKALLKKARKILFKAGAVACYVHKIKTFSHAAGTVRMGEDPATSALDQYCQFRGMSNFFVVDGSFMSTAGGLNPSLTISANALRVGEYIVKKPSPVH
ncbi:MAG: GMC family oxidoreductase [bacterium]